MTGIAFLTVLAVGLTFFESVGLLGNGVSFLLYHTSSSTKSFATTNETSNGGFIDV
jgi:hypothetical protein